MTKTIKRHCSILLCFLLVMQLFGCKSNKLDAQQDPVTGATVFQALKDQVKFDSILTDVLNPEDLFENLPEGSDVTLYKGPDADSDQLGMIEVPKQSDLDAAEESVNNYLQQQYDAVAKNDPDAATKFENVAIWKYDIYIVFCITINYNTAVQIINNTVSGQGVVESTENENKGETPATEPVTSNVFSGRWEISGHPAVYEAFDKVSESRIVYLDISVSDDCVRISPNGAETVTYNTFEVTQAQGYPCLLIDADGNNVGFIMINFDMIGMIDTNLDRGRNRELSIQGTKYNGAFLPLENLYMREGNGTTTLPKNLNMDTILKDVDVGDTVLKYFYYPVSNILQIFGSKPSQEFYLEGVYYVKGLNSLEYIEEMTLPWAKNLPSGTIYTEHNFVIADNK